MGAPKVLVKNDNINEGVSGSINWHAPSIHKRNFITKISKRSVRNWTRYSSLKICQNESNKNHIMQSHMKKTVMLLGDFIKETNYTGLVHLITRLPTAT